MRTPRVAATALFVLVIAGLLSPAPGVGLNASTRAITIFPHVGIGTVKLGETHAAVDRAHGKGSLQRRGMFMGSYKYRSGAITIYVTYGPKKRVSGVSTANGAALVYGRRLWDGQHKLAPILHRHGWADSVCEGLPFTELTSGGAGTGIIWKQGKTHEAMVGPGSGQCLPPGGY